MALDATYLTPVAGAEVRMAIDELLTPAAGADLQPLVVERGVLVFRGLYLVDRQQLIVVGPLSEDRDEGADGILEVAFDPAPNAGAGSFKDDRAPGDLPIWDSTGVLHRAESYLLDRGQMMHRTNLLGEEALA